MDALYFEMESSVEFWGGLFLFYLPHFYRNYFLLFIRNICLGHGRRNHQKHKSNPLPCIDHVAGNEQQSQPK
jgi:hypothetical protein